MNNTIIKMYQLVTLLFLWKPLKIERRRFKDSFRVVKELISLVHTASNCCCVNLFTALQGQKTIRCQYDQFAESQNQHQREKLLEMKRKLCHCNRPPLSKQDVYSLNGRPRLWRMHSEIKWLRNWIFYAIEPKDVHDIGLVAVALIGK